MAEPVEKARRQSTIEDRIEDEFQRAVGGIPAIERMREEYHHTLCRYSIAAQRY